ncbi:MAG: TOPRIM nucleotidyl transferase/hydrolase domain-containing protein, partial [Pseudomonadota bacterium]
MNRLINNIFEASGKQVILTTHNPLVASRLDLRNVFVLTNSSDRPATLSGVSEDVAQYFMKAPGSSLLEFILSTKTILVEGAAEYILMEAFFHKVTGKHTSEMGTQVIS